LIFFLVRRTNFASYEETPAVHYGANFIFIMKIWAKTLWFTKPSASGTGSHAPDPLIGEVSSALSIRRSAMESDGVRDLLSPNHIPGHFTLHGDWNSPYFTAKHLAIMRHFLSPTSPDSFVCLFVCFSSAQNNSKSYGIIGMKFSEWERKGKGGVGPPYANSWIRPW